MKVPDSMTMGELRAASADLRHEINVAIQKYVTRIGAYPKAIRIETLEHNSHFEEGPDVVMYNVTVVRPDL